MDNRIGETQRLSPVPPRRSRERDANGERRFVLPSRDPREDSAEGDEEHVILEPQPRPEGSDKPVSRSRSDDEVGHQIDVRG